MKILFFIQTLIGGGAERVTVNLSEELVRRGHNVTIALTDNIIDYNIDPRIKIVVYPSAYDYKGHIVLVRKLYSFLNRVKDNIDTKRIINRIKPDVIVASWGSKVESILRYHGKIPAISSEHNTFDREHAQWERKLRFFTNKKFNKVVVLTEYDKEFVKDYLNNTLVIPNPLTFNPISKEEFRNTYSCRKNLLACGRINAYLIKGFDNLIIAFAKIAAKYPHWDLDIAGEGSEENINKLKKLAQEEGVGDRIHFLGFCRNIGEIMKQHSIFVLSSRSEGFGMVVTEAMAMGCTCLSFALTGPSEIIESGVDGILVENQNIDKLSEAMSNLMQDEDLRIRLSENALNSVRRFTVDRIADQWEYLFNKLILNE